MDPHHSINSRQQAGGAVLQLPVFRIRHLSKTDGAGELAVRALREVDLEIMRGKIIVLLGAS